jgi:glycosyltransferase involved in cell wall biosynthesis
LPRLGIAQSLEIDLRRSDALNTGQPHLHLINPLRNPAGGSEWRTLNLYKELANRTQTTLWCDGQPAPRIAAEFPVKSLNVKRLSFPRTGTFVFMGVYFRPGRWIWLTRPTRVIITYNTPHLSRLQDTRERFLRVFKFEPEIVYCSELLRQEAGLPGVVETSLFDTAAFARSEKPLSDVFTIGRLSRPNALKHHPDDLPFYRRLAAAGCRIEVMGATDEMIEKGRELPGVNLLPSCAVESNVFLQNLDCFFYRTDPSWREPWGRVITEAMAASLPIVAEKGGGYAAIIEHGRNGFLFETEEEAYDILFKLKSDPELRKSIGEAGRQTVERLFTAEARSSIANYYLK